MASTKQRFSSTFIFNFYIRLLILAGPTIDLSDAVVQPIPGSSTLTCLSPCQCTAGKVDCTLAGLSQWPRDLPSNTTTLILTRNRLERVNAVDLQRYPSLKTLILSHNRIDKLDIGNAIQDQLENLDLSFNQLSELNFLAAFPKLRHLNVAFNSLKGKLGNDSLIHNVKLQWLSLNGNPIQMLESNMFRRNEFLGYLSLSGMEIDALPAKILDPLARLQQLEVRDNRKLSILKEDVFRFLGGSLRHLNLANNSLSALPRSLRQLEALRTLNLDGNPFECDCQLFWFANWLEKRPSVVPSTNMFCSGHQPLIESLWGMHCSAVRLETSTLFQEELMGKSVVLTCNFSGNPAPSVTWVTPNRTTLHYDPNNVDKTNGTVRLLSPGQLQVGSLGRETAGSYSCHASNALSNVTAFMRVQIEPRGFRRVQIQSIIAGFGAVTAFVLITLIVQGFRYLMDRFGWWECCYCCGKRLSPRAKQIRTLLEAIEQYKSQQLERMRENYNLQVQRIRENCVQQIERIQQGYSGQVKYLRGVRVYGTQQLSTIREQYNDQTKKVYDYTVERLQNVQRNYVSQRSKVRKFSAHQLIRLREKYKFQQKTLNKILENLPAFYIDSCRTGATACARTDSVYFQQDGLDAEVDVVESIIKQGIQLDLPDVCLEDLPGSELMEEIPIDGSMPGEESSVLPGSSKKSHGRNPSAGSLDLSFLFPPIRFPSLNWRRRNTVDEESPTAPTVAEDEDSSSGGTALKVAVEICPVPVDRAEEHISNGSCNINPHSQSAPTDC